MIYITTEKLNLLLYYCRIQHPQKELNYYGLNKEINLKLVKEIICQGDPLEPPINIINFNLEEAFNINYLKNINPNNITYLRVKDFKTLTNLEKHNIQTLKISSKNYHYGLKGLKKFITTEAEEWLWRKWTNDPRKANLETIQLILYAIKNKKIIDINLLENIYHFENNEDLNIKYLLSKLGTEEGGNLILNISEQNLWRIFIGSINKPPLIYSLLKPSLKKEIMILSLDIIKEQINLKLIKLKPGIIIWHTWFTLELNKKNPFLFNSYLTLKNKKKF